MEVNLKTGAVRGVGVLCATLASAMVLAASSTAHGTSQARSDARLAAEVQTRLKADPVYFYRHVSVSVHDGVAHLGGYVWSTDGLYRAEAIAREVPGVTGVVDRMRLGPSGATGANDQ
jgi:osmotically-inducible protein OsmY